MKAKRMLAMMFTPLLSAMAAAEEVAIQGKDGKTIQAEILSADADSVQIRRADGKEFDLPFARISDESAKAIRETMAAREKAAADEAAAKEAAKPVERVKAPRLPQSPDELAEKLMVKKGSTIIATFKLAVDGLARPVIVEKEPEDAPYIRVNVTQQDDQTVVTVTSTFDRTVLVRCLGRDKDQQSWYATNFPALAKGEPSVEHWEAEMEELVFYDFAFLDETEGKPAE